MTSKQTLDDPTPQRESLFDLQDIDEVRKAIIANEILNRKY